MQVSSIDVNLNFGNKSILKTEFRRGRIPLKKDITGNPLKIGEETVDHTIPKSKGGKSNLSNYTLMNSVINNKRGNKPIRQYIDLESLIEYLRVMLDVKTPDLDGVKYVKDLLKTLSKALKQNL